MALTDRLKRTARAVLRPTSNSAAANMDAMLQLELSRELARLQADVRAAMPDNPAAWGFKVYSQADEDGIIEEICRRIGIERGSFIEIGCGDGRENNSHYLLLKGWRGIWVDGDANNTATIRTAVPIDGRLRLVEQMVTRDNVTTIPVAAGSPGFGALDLLSVDVDGNDLAIAEVAIEAWSPKVVIGEYNAKFPPPLKLEVDYDPAHRWAGNDHHGASLAAWVERLKPDYRLVTCNLAGSNAFFVRDDLAAGFKPYEAAKLFQPARFHLTALRSGHVPSLSFLRDSLRRSPSV